MGQVNMLELAKKLNVRKFIYASSSSVYGGNKKMPFSQIKRLIIQFPCTLHQKNLLNLWLNVILIYLILNAQD